MEQDRLKGVYFFEDKDGYQPVKEFLHSLTQKEQAKVRAYIRELKKQGNNLRRPMADYLEDGIYELRPKENRIFYYFYLRDRAILVHAIKKHVKKVPENDLRLCIKRKIEIGDCVANLERLEL
ncbi:MAG: type II toxin-antitoxin system RelE/ParE family toxin [Candidatus Omnitrophota bacterium]